MSAPVILAFFFGAGLVFALYYTYTLLPGMLRQRALNKRLEEVSQLSAADPESGESRKAILKEQPVGPLPALDRLVSGSTRGSAISQR